MRKKLFGILGLSALAVLSLSSCDKEEKIEKLDVVQPTEKGKTVDSIETTEISVNNKMTFAEIIESLSNSIDVVPNYNYYRSNLVEKDNNVSSNYVNFDDKSSYGDYKTSFAMVNSSSEYENTECIDFYNNKVVAENGYNVESYSHNYFDSKSILKIDNNKSTRNDKNDTFQVTKYNTKQENGVTYEKLERGYYYNNLHDIEASNGYTTIMKSKNGSYINAQENSEEEYYNKPYSGYDPKTTNNVTYSISDDTDSYRYSLDLYEVSLDSFYNSDLKDYFTTSYELTDKYIILKSEHDYENILVSDNSKLEIGKRNNDVTKASYELWIDYSDDNFGYVYYKGYEESKIIKSGIYQSSDFENYSSKAFYNDLLEHVGESYRYEETYKEEREISTFALGNEASKVNNFIEKAKKNNDYKNIKFYPFDGYSGGFVK